MVEPADERRLKSASHRLGLNRCGEGPFSEDHSNKAMPLRGSRNGPLAPVPRSPQPGGGGRHQSERLDVINRHRNGQKPSSLAGVLDGFTKQNSFV